MVMSRKQFWSFVKDPILGYINITDMDRMLIDSQPVQRLRRIRQLSLADIVYPGATHTRFEHSLGVMEIASRMAMNLPIEISEEDVFLVRMAGLLHDVGHGPLSHLFEYHLKKYLNKNHEDMGVWIIEKSELSDIISSLGYTTDEVIDIALGKKDVKPSYMRQIIRSAVDADKLDFIRRDNYHTGAGYGNVDVERIIYTLEVFDNKLAVNATSLSTLETFILARVKSFEAIYYHKTIRAAQLMILKAIDLALKETGLSFNSPEDYLELDDYSLWCMISRNEKSKEVLKKIRRRELIKLAYERKYIIGDELIVNLISNERIRIKTIEELAALSGAGPEDIYRHALTAFTSISQILRV